MLFGSYANGEPNENSDIDLHIVTKDDLIPQSWRAKSDLRLLSIHNSFLILELSIRWI
jgi:predicted nucleotidyltransferase